VNDEKLSPAQLAALEELAQVARDYEREERAAKREFGSWRGGAFVVRLPSIDLQVDARGEPMSALGQNQTFAAQKGMSALPESGHSEARSKCPLSAISRLVDAGSFKITIVERVTEPVG